MQAYLGDALYWTVIAAVGAIALSYLMDSAATITHIVKL